MSAGERRLEHEQPEDGDDADESRSEDVSRFLDRLRAAQLSQEAQGKQAEAPGQGDVGLELEALESERAEALRRLQELMREGHGPQRHEGNPSPEAVRGRLGQFDRTEDGQVRLDSDGEPVRVGHRDPELFDAPDPAKGQFEDKYTGDPHRCGFHATRIPSPEDYCRAESVARAEAERAAAARPRALGPVRVRISLEEALGPDYEAKCQGWYLTERDPSGYGDSDFRGGTLFALYLRDGDRLKLHTLYPDPDRTAPRW